MEYSASKASEDIYNAFRNGDIKLLRKISNQSAEAMTTASDKGMLSLSMISYVLGKIMEKPRYLRQEKTEELAQFVENTLLECSNSAKKKDMAAFDTACDELIKRLGEFDESNRRYVQGLFDKAKLKIAARMYAQGFSLSYVVSITGSNTRDVLKYIGQTLMFDRVGKTKSIEERLSNARRIFR